jgi:hypothetical protein
MSGWAIEVRVPPGSRAATAAQRTGPGPGGRAIFSGMEQDEAAGFLTVLDHEAFAPIEEVCDAGWWAVGARCR